MRFQFLCFLIICLINCLTAQRPLNSTTHAVIHVECKQSDWPAGVECMVAYVIHGNQSTVNIWEDYVKFEGDNVKFTQIPSAIYDLSPKVKNLHFEDVGLKTIEVGDVRQLEQLNIRGSSIEILNDNIFVQSPEMTDLSLSNNKINEIKKDAFKGLTNLNNLLLNRNPITTILEGTFEHVPALEILTIEKCFIQVLPANLLSPLKSLTYLVLGLNKLSSFNATALGVTSSLPRLDLNDNKINHLDLSNLSLLRALRMDGNKMTILNSKMFHNDEMSKTFDFSKNKIDFVDPQLFEKNPKLSLEFEHNPCATLTEEHDGDYEGVFTVRASNAAGNLKVCFSNY